MQAGLVTLAKEVVTVGMEAPSYSLWRFHGWGSSLTNHSNHNNDEGNNNADMGLYLSAPHCWLSPIGSRDESHAGYLG